MAKLDIKVLMKVYYNVLVMLESKNSMLELARANPEAMIQSEMFLLEKDIAETKDAILSLKELIKDAYGVSTFGEIAPEVLRWIEEDPYHQLTRRLFGAAHDLSIQAVDDGFSLWTAPKSKDIN